MPILIQPEQLSSEALLGIIDNFIVREGTDYGWNEVTHEKKIEQVQRQLERGEIKIVFDQTTETVSLLTEREYRRFTAPK